MPSADENQGWLVLCEQAMNARQPQLVPQFENRSLDRQKLRKHWHLTVNALDVPCDPRRVSLREPLCRHVAIADPEGLRFGQILLRVMER